MCQHVECFTRYSLIHTTMFPSFPLLNDFPFDDWGRNIVWLSVIGHSDKQVRHSVRPQTFVFPSADSRRAVVGYWRNYVHLVLLNSLGGLRLSRNSMVRLTVRPGMTIAVYCGLTATKKKKNSIIALKTTCIQTI